LGNGKTKPSSRPVAIERVDEKGLEKFQTEEGEKEKKGEQQKSYKH